MMRKSILLGLGLSLCVAFQSYAAGWQQDNNGCLLYTSSDSIVRYDTVDVCAFLFEIHAPGNQIQLTGK